MAQGERFKLFLKNTFPTATYFSGWSHTSGKSSKNFGVKRLKTPFKKNSGAKVLFDLRHPVRINTIYKLAHRDCTRRHSIHMLFIR